MDIGLNMNSNQTKCRMVKTKQMPDLGLREIK